MAVSTATTVDIASVLEGILDGIDGLRAHRYVADNFRPPGAVIAMPTITYDDPDAPFCQATFDFPVSLVANRNQDRAGQDALARMVSEVAQALDEAEVEGVFSIEPLTAVPTSIDVSGVSLPAYNMRVRVRA